MPREELPQWVHDRRRELGDRIRDLRDEAGLTQEQFAERSGIDRRTLQRYERADTEVPYSALLLIAHALEIPLSDLTR
ncbi:helix-turn-helix transcriptional regulator [Streptomyces sp. NPDC051320]|uniref:helix-turn-helix domain-containing protein n=1 Tax=Streptomyces sp. NPDC051320 TaxID=3154644 RepID=UPI003412C176